MDFRSRALIAGPYQHYLLIRRYVMKGNVRFQIAGVFRLAAIALILPASAYVLAADPPKPAEREKSSHDKVGESTPAAERAQQPAAHSRDAARRSDERRQQSADKNRVERPHPAD